MATQTALKCYRFEGVDFIPENKMLLWQNQQQTFLTHDESILLHSLCHLAGEVISAESLYRHIFTHPHAFEESSDHQYDINLLLTSLTKKLNTNGKMGIPIYVIPNHGFRVPLPIRICNRNELTTSPHPVKDIKKPTIEKHTNTLHQQIKNHSPLVIYLISLILILLVILLVTIMR